MKEILGLSRSETEKLNRAWMRKRLFDLLVTIGGSIVWVPVVVGCACAVWGLDGRPIFYWSWRRVFRNQTIPIVKFRTMIRGAEQLANRKTIPIGQQRFLNIPLDSPLYTPVGRLIERFHITELPQFFQVLSGKMCIVGNRPLPQDVVDALLEVFPHAEERFAVRGGMTGPVQLIGRDAISDASRLALEIEYCRVSLAGYSMRLDFVILGLTILIGLRLIRARSIDEVRALLRKHSQVRE